MVLCVFALHMFDKMAQKRIPDDSSNKRNSEGNHSPDDKRRRSLPSFQSVVQELMSQGCFQRVLEPMLRRVVKEEVESAIRKHFISFKRNCEEAVFPSESRNLQLKFLSKLSLPVFTGTRIEGEDGAGIKVALIDSFTDEVVQYSPESSAKVEIVVLEGDFDGDEGDNWTLEEFKNNIVREREGKKPLLTGDVFLYLKEGIGSVGEISFTDNSSWTRSRRFRLGARVVGNSDGARIREAKSESFIVRDHRGELYKKHHPPSLGDEVWRLEKIGKDGAFHKRLSLERVNTVKDFLILLNLDPARLRNILGSGMSAKMWEVAIEHARTCVLDERVYVYYSPSSPHTNGVVFNVVGQAMGLYSESEYVIIDKLSETEKLDAQRLVIEAFQHWDGVISFDDLNSLIGVSSSTAISSTTGTPDSGKLLVSQKTNGLDYAQPSVSSPDILSSLYSMGCMSSSDSFSLHAVDTLYSPPMDIPLPITDSLLCNPNCMTPAFHNELGFLDFDYSLHSSNPSLGSQADLLSILRPHTGRSQAHRRWKVLFSIFKMIFNREVGNEDKKRDRQVIRRCCN